MSRRSERLLALMQALRRRRRPVTGQVLAEEMGVSVRSLYRDIETLKSLGLDVDGEAGIGFWLRADSFLPPLTFTAEELEAVVLGLRKVIYGRDSAMETAARDALAKVNAALPKARKDELEAVGLFALPQAGHEGESAVLAILRRALREERQVRLSYRDHDGETTVRVIYPVGIGYLEDRELLLAWCTLRSDYRRFRIEGIVNADVLEDRLPEPRRSLLHRWRMAHGLPELT